MKKALLVIVLIACFANCVNTGKSGEGEKNLATALAEAGINFLQIILLNLFLLKLSSNFFYNIKT